MGNFNRDDRSAGGYRGGFSRGRGSFGGGRGGDRGDRPMFKAICSNCGKECEVPFRPTNGKPVYCSDCFEKMGKRNDRQPGRAPQAQGGPDLSAINTKLDKILNLLEPKVIAPPPAAIPVVKTEKIADKVDISKIKKVVKKAASKKEK